MKVVRTALFWLHLAAGVVAGVVILIMSITGVALTYERQMVEWDASHLRSVPPSATATPIAVESLLEQVRRDHPDSTISGVTMSARRDAPVVVAAEPDALLVDAYTGRTLGTRAEGGMRAFMSRMRAWHRWLAAEGEGRPLARAITGWSNALFLFIVISGIWIWVPRVWTSAQFRNVLFFKRRYGTSKARDFNWHNVIGIWSAVPLFIVVLGAVPISFPWASDLLYRAAGEEPPARGRGPGGPPAGARGGGRAGGPRGAGRAEAGSAAPAVTTTNLNRLFAVAAAEQSGWRTITLRLPRRAGDPLTFNIDRGDGGQPQLRSTLTLDRAGTVVARETFGDQSPGRQARSILRFAHTGEVLGIPGQTVAGLASGGAVVMVWTGLALTWRRFRAWLARRPVPSLHPVDGLATSAARASGASFTQPPHAQSADGTRGGRRRTSLLVAAPIATAAGLGAAAPAQAQTLSPAPQSATSPDDTTFPFDIPAGMLDEVAAAFTRITGIAVTFANAELATLPSPGVRGAMSAAAGMTQLLMGTSVQARFDAAGVTLDVARLSESVSVVGGGNDAPAVSSPRYTVPLRDVAQTIAVVPRAIIEQRAAATLTDVLRNVPGITLQAGEGGGSANTAGDMFNMRGFSANNSLFVDNVRDSGLIARDIFNVEQVEVFMGPTGSDVGRGTAAGYVNMATKRPHLGTTASAIASVGSASQGRVTADINWGGPANAGWWSHAAFRINTLWQDSGVAGRDFVQNRSEGVAPSLALGLDTQTRVFTSGQFVRQDNVPDYGVPTAAWPEDLLAVGVAQTTRPVRQANYYGTPELDYDRADQNAVLVRAEHDVRRGLTVSNQTRVNRTHRDAVVSAITNLAAYNPATGLVTIARQGNERENTIVSNQTTVVSRLVTGPLRHGASGGVELLREHQFAPGKQGMGTAAPVDIFSPNPRAPIADYSPSRSLAETDGTTNSLAVYANDTVEVGMRWLASGGFRLERYDTNYRAVDVAGVTTTNLGADGTLFSGRGSLLYRLNDASNVYVSYGTTVTPPGEGNFQLSAAANNVNNPNLDPQRSANLEAGTKVDLAGGRVSLTGAAFRTRNRNIIYTIDATAVPPIFNQDDDQLVKGVTGGALGQITDRWRVLANGAYLAATLESQGPDNGRRLVLTPAFSGSLWSTVRVAGSLTVGGGVQHVGSSYVNAANTTRIPSYTLVDGLVEYAVNSHLTLRLNVNNLTDEMYVRNVNNNGGRYNPGYRRSALLTSQIGF